MRSTAGALAILAFGAIASAAPTPTPTTAPTPTAVQVPWIVNCQDDTPENGYLFEGYCVPGVVTYETSRFTHPRYFGGAMSSYAKGVMERVVANRGMGLGGYKGAVALMGCGDIGKTVRILRPGEGWDGPFLVADCSGRSGLYEYIMVRRLAVEVDYETAMRYGSLTLPWVDVMVEGNQGGLIGMSLATWFERNVLAFSWNPSLVDATPSATRRPPTSTPSPPPTVVHLEAIAEVILGPPAPFAPEAPMFANLLFWLLVGHAVADFTLQSDRMSMLKRPTRAPVIGGPWWFWMTAHALVHGGAAALAVSPRGPTASLAVGVTETVIHFFIDTLPDRNAYVDQAMHIGLKVLYAILVSL